MLHHGKLAIAHTATLQLRANGLLMKKCTCLHVDQESSKTSIN